MVKHREESVHRILSFVNGKIYIKLLAPGPSAHYYCLRHEKEKKTY